MALRDPVAVYNAANNMEAVLIRDLLVDAGIEAFVTEDFSPVGTWAFGLLPELHKPQVWTDKTDAMRAKPILDDYERSAAERRQSVTDNLAAAPPLEVVCEECGRSSHFPAAQRGSVQKCPHCGAYVDVDADGPPEDWSQAEDADAEEEL
jgi:hypothetical protein